MDSTVGFRSARPTRSARTRAAAIGQLRASARAGTARRLIAYPMNVTSQYLPVLSLMYPDTERSPYPRNSPKPATMLIVAAPAPSEPRKGPLTLAAPSYVTSANRLTTPIVNTKANADDPAVATIVFFVMPVVDEDHFVAPAPPSWSSIGLPSGSST